MKVPGVTKGLCSKNYQAETVKQTGNLSCKLFAFEYPALGNCDMVTNHLNQESLPAELQLRGKNAPAVSLLKTESGCAS